MRDLVALGQIGIEIVFAAKRDLSWMRRVAGPSEARGGQLDARRLSTGSAPGKPRHTGQVLALGGSPKRVEQAQKILVAVRSCTWTSRPITGSYLARASGLRDTVSADLVILKSRKWNSTEGNESPLGGVVRTPPPPLFFVKDVKTKGLCFVSAQGYEENKGVIQLAVGPSNVWR